MFTLVFHPAGDRVSGVSAIVPTRLASPQDSKTSVSPLILPEEHYYRIRLLCLTFMWLLRLYTFIFNPLYPVNHLLNINFMAL